MPRKRVRKRLTNRKEKALSKSVKLHPTPRLSVKRLQWSNQQMEAAIKAVESGSGINKAARDHGVPITTLKDRISGKVEHGRKPGPQGYLSKSEEHDLGVFLKECAGIGYGKTRSDVMHIAQSVAVEKGVLRKSRITHGWWSRFLQRQGDLCLRRGDSTAHSRMDAVNKETISHYFKLLKDVVDECGLLDNPAQIYNVDESGIPFDFKTPNVVAEIGSKKVRYRQAGKKGQVTIVGCANAIGQAIPPMIIFDAKNLNHAWTKNEVPGTRYGLSDNGWINTDLFEGWLAEHFIKHAVPGRPLLLLLDGHSTHYQPDVIRFARDHDVVMLCLPPHTTHETQPLDVGVFSSLKSQWTKVCHDYFQNNPGKVITRFNFNLLFSKAWLKSLIPANIIAGFKKCGVYPYDPDAIVVPGKTSKKKPQPQGDDEASPQNRESHEDQDGGGACDSCEDDENGGDACDGCEDNENGGDACDGFEDDENSGDACDGCEGDEHGGSAHGEGNKGGGGGSGSPSRFGESELLEQDKLELYERRFEEGYDLLLDGDYVDWLKLYHPEALPPDNSLSLTDIFSAVTPETPLVISDAQQRSDSYKNDVTVTTEFSTAINGLPVTPQSQLLSGNDRNSSSSGKKSTISKYLVSPTVNTPCTKKPASRARLLTSADSLAQLEEKERKKREEQEMKEQKKREREERKKQKEDERKHKVAERAKREEERALKKARIEEERAKKAEMKAKKASKVEEARKKKDTKVPSNSAWEPSISTVSTASTTAVAKSNLRRIRPTPEKAANKIDINTCCMCNIMYEDDILSGSDWISCACGRWLHEDCAEDCVIDNDGKERFCFLCLELFS